MASNGSRNPTALAAVSVVALLLLVGALWGVVFVDFRGASGADAVASTAKGGTPDQADRSPSSGGSDSSGESDATDPSSSAEDVWTMDDARAALAQEGSHTLVLGDGTGDGFDEWAFLWAGARGLPAAMWMTQTEAGYSGVTEDTRLWSGSAVEATADYRLEHWDAMWPEETPDLVLLSFGHFAPSPQEATASLEELRATIAEAAPETPIVVILQNPQADDANAEVRQAIAAWAKEAGLPTIDVAAAFADSGEIPANLRLDELHPSTAGSELWAQTVGETLG